MTDSIETIVQETAQSVATREDFFGVCSNKPKKVFIESMGKHIFIKQLSAASRDRWEGYLVDIGTNARKEEVEKHIKRKLTKGDEISKILRENHDLIEKITDRVQDEAQGLSSAYRIAECVVDEKGVRRFSLKDLKKLAAMDSIVAAEIINAIDNFNVISDASVNEAIDSLKKTD